MPHHRGVAVANAGWLVADALSQRPLGDNRIDQEGVDRTTLP